LADTRVVVIVGARQVGKSTLARLIVSDRPGVEQRGLDVPAIRAAASADPVEFVRHEGLLVIDEVQRVPELLLVIKDRVDLEPRAGQFLLTGSAQVMAGPQHADALTGRAETIVLWSFSQGEIDNAPDGLAQVLLTGVDPREVVAPGADDKRAYLARALRGGYPEAVVRDERRRGAFFSSYLGDLINRDIKQLRAIRRGSDLRRLLAAAAARMVRPLVVERLAADLGIPARTLDSYLELLEAVYLVRRLPAFANSRTRRAVAHPKLLFTDSGVAGHLTGQSLERLMRPSGAAGVLLENFVLAELARQLTWADDEAELLHYRTRDGVEVDGVLEARDGRVVGIEVKAASTVTLDDFRHLRHLAERTASDFVCGVLLYTGPDVLPFGSTLWALPMDALWRTPVP
jgi:predicted AAA+ superfamily ATPase